MNRLLPHRRPLPRQIHRLPSRRLRRHPAPRRAPRLQLRRRTIRLERPGRAPSTTSCRLACAETRGWRDPAPGAPAAVIGAVVNIERLGRRSGLRGASAPDRLCLLIASACGPHVANRARSLPLLRIKLPPSVHFRGRSCEKKIGRINGDHLREAILCRTFRQ
jgi:hypothetical protein